jgi:benzoylformate decarboxylase/acetolactate synthase-1/2/3 large subunit
MGPEPVRFGSDVMVDLLVGQGIRHVALNPGASFRGLHDSLVNRSPAPNIILVPHEKLAVNLAHGYAKAAGQPMAAVLHDTVGLLHGALGVFTAFVDRAPVIVLGGAGPTDAARRRPWIDWVHTANIQGDAVRAYTKWDDQPASIEALPGAFARARSMAIGEPAGPVYLALDAELQEREVAGPPAVPDWSRLGPAHRIAGDEAALAVVADGLVTAARPILVAGFAGRDARAFDWLPRLADLVGAGVVDLDDRLNMPTQHALNVTGTDAIGEADLVVLLDVKDPSRALLTTRPPAREAISRLAPGCRIVDIGFNDLQVSAWVQDAGPALPMDLRVTADTTLALPRLLDLVTERLAGERATRRADRERRRARLASLHAETRAAWAAVARRRANDRPISPAHLAAAVWSAIRETDWVLTAGTANDWALRLWDVDRAYRHPGRSQGTATQIGISLGVALAHRGTGRLVVDLQPDGDLMFDPGALWVAAAERIPLLAVMVNNRAYYNDWEHQVRMAELRGSNLERAHVGVAIDDPAPDFAALARSFGWHAEGPIEDPAAVTDAVRVAARVVLETGTPALVDVVTAHR